jgi:transposase InsO family protein
MDVHDNARLTPRGREAMVRAVVDDGLTQAEVARRFNTSAKTAGKWIGRFRANGVAGLRDRSSRPLSSPSQTALATCDAVEALRRQRRTQATIAAETGLSPATVSRILKRRGLSLLSALEPAEPRPRYERATPGEIIHIDIKKLGGFNAVGHRITGDRTGQSNQRSRAGAAGPGWEFVHIAIDDHSRLAFSQILPDEKQASAIAFLEAAVGHYRRLGVEVARVMTDNGSCYKSRAFGEACRLLAIKHIRTKPYTPQTNGKAERFIQTALREWAYATAFNTSDQRRAELPRWLHRYNWHRSHASLGGKQPISRLPITRNNLLTLHS